MSASAMIRSDAATGGGILAAMLARDGSAAHPMASGLRGPHAHPRELADVVHHLCTVHGTQPGVCDLARDHAHTAGARDWLTRSAAAFSGERTYVVALAAAAGPLPSTPRHAEAEAAIVAQQHALAMLARSDRIGCALGAAVALVLDWPAIRAVLDNAAARFGIDRTPSDLPSVAETEAMIAEAARVDGVARAIRFGGQQLLAQHRGLWDLLQARSDARG